VNSDLVGKYVNIASRAAGFLVNYFDGHLADIISLDYGKSIELRQLESSKHGLHHELLDKVDLIQAHMENRRYNQAISVIMALTDKVNEYWDQQKPWEKAKQIKNSPTELAMDHPIKFSLHLVSSITIECFRILTILLKPVLPVLAEKAESFLNVEPLRWIDLKKTMKPGHQIKAYEHLVTRIDRKKIDAMIESSK
jgi:methionyl-tRNA synthetase